MPCPRFVAEPRHDCLPQSFGLLLCHLGLREKLFRPLGICFGPPEQAKPRRAKLRVRLEPRVHPSLAQLQLDFPALVASGTGNHFKGIMQEMGADDTEGLSAAASWWTRLQIFSGVLGCL